jgi:WXG100 family type VII secretion target
MSGTNVVDNPKFIRVDTDAIKTKMESLKTEKNTIDDVLNKFSSDIKGMPSYWNGSTADKVTEELNNYIATFVNISNQLEKYINFMQSVSDTYEAFDKYLIEQIGSEE